MTNKQIEQFNRMLLALTVISKEYQSPDELRECAEEDYGVDFEEALEMSYENIQDEARLAIAGVKPI